MSTDKPVTLAAIIGAHGVTGEVRLKLFGEGVAALVAVALVASVLLFVVVVGVFNVYVRTVYYTSLYVWTRATEEAAEVGGKVFVPAPLAAALA